MLAQLVASVGMLGDRDPAIFITAAFRPEAVANTIHRVTLVHWLLNLKILKLVS